MGTIPQNDPVALVENALLQHGSIITNRKQDSFMAQCPAHDDNEPSLSVTRKPDKVLLHCFAGCTTADICNELGIKVSELYAREPKDHFSTSSDKHNPGTVKANLAPIPFSARMEGERTVYEYRDSDRQILYENERITKADGNKTFAAYSYDAAGNRVAGLRGRKQIPYGLKELLQAKPGDVVHITEGEKDTISLRSIGLLAVSLSKGALKNPELKEWFRDLEIVIHVDNDEPGRTHAEKVAEALS